MKSDDYIKILDENWQLLAQNFDPGRRFTFQQDHDFKDKSKSVTVRLQKNKMTVLSWPSMRADFESYWKPMARIKRSNKSSVTKKPIETTRSDGG